MVRPFLWVVLAASGALVTARAALGPFHIFGASIDSPLNLESFLAVSGLLLIAMQSRKEPVTAAGRARDWWAIPLLAAVGLSAWIWIAGIPFLADDYGHIDNSLRATPAYLAGLFTVPAIDRFFRPLVLLGYAAQARLWGADRIAWHLGSILVHIANSVLVYCLARSWRIPFWPALAGGLFFLLNGSRPEAVAWVGAQFDLLATLFFLLALLALQRAMKARNLWWEAGSLVALLLALLCKESAYVFPAVAVLILAAAGLRGKQLARLAVPPAILTALVFTYRWHVLEGLGGYRVRGSGQSLLLSIGLLRTPKALFLRLPAIVMFPVNWTRPLEWWLILLFAAAVVAWGILASARASRRAVWLALALALVCAAPIHEFLLIGVNLEKSRVLYLPSVAFALLLAAAIAGMNRRIALPAVIAILAFQTAALEHNLLIWRSVAQLAERTCVGAAIQLRDASGPVLVYDLPNDIDGVYFLHTGLRACIEWAAGDAARNLRLEDEPQSGAVTRELVWDSRRQAWSNLSQDPAHQHRQQDR